MGVEKRDRHKPGRRETVLDADTMKDLSLNPSFNRGEEGGAVIWVVTEVRLEPLVNENQELQEERPLSLEVVD